MKSNILWIVILCMSVPVLEAHAQALYSVSFDEKVKNAPLIVEGKVESKLSFWNKSHTMIFTSNRVKLYKVFKGNSSEDYIDVLTQGGSVGGDAVEVSDLLQLEPGDVGTFFCMPNSINLLSPLNSKLLYDVYASAQGCYKYNILTLTASDPIDKFTSITTNLYPAITALTGGSYIDKQPSISFGKPPAATGMELNGIISFSPQVVNAGAFQQADSNLLTISGTGFGAKTSNAAILFDDPDNGTDGTPYTVVATSSLVTSWTDTEIKIKVPSKAGTGIITVQTDGGTLYPSATPLLVNYSVITSSFPNGSTTYIAQSNLMSVNGAGGYDIKYSTSTANSGRDMSIAPEKATFQRALATWKEICGANIREAGNTSNQAISSDDENVIVLDNTQTGVTPLPTGVLAITYSYSSTCQPVGQYPARKTGFDVLIRNSGVSAGNTNFAIGPCPPATSFVQTDLETVLLHELGHAINLYHIIGPHQGSTLPYINPSLLMNYAVVNGVKRVSPDYAAKTGADYCIRPKGQNYGSCITGIAEMVPLATTLEAKDECPLSFPVNTTYQNTQLAFDLVHATSNLNVDPQYTAIKCDGLGTGVTNTAFAAIKTNSAGKLSITVSNYATTPTAQAACTPAGAAGVEMAIYQVNSCPAAQNFPAPYACRSFNANGPITDITGLAANFTYLLMVDGINNTKANFTLTLNGSILPVKIRDFNGSVSGNDNIIYWLFDALNDVASVSLERSVNGSTFDPIKTWNAASFALQGNFTDLNAPLVSYYRLKFAGADGKEQYSNIINLTRTSKQAWRIYPNPAKSAINLYVQGAVPGKYVAKVYSSAGMLVARQSVEINAASQRMVIPAGTLATGNYKIIVSGNDGENVYRGNVSVIK